MKAKGSMGWVFLLAALAVPGFLFYHWWSGLNSDMKSQTSQKAKRRVPEGELFGGQEDSAKKFTNPIVSTDAAAAQAPAAMPQQPDPAPASAAAAAPAEPAPAPVEGAVPVAVQEAPTVPAPAPAAEFRDPTLSPYDIYRMELAELERQNRQREVQNAVVVVRPVRRREPPIESTINLQGIVSNAEGGHKAIVNGEMFAEGDRVANVKILQITQKGVVFLHKNKKFTKSVRR